MWLLINQLKFHGSEGSFTFGEPMGVKFEPAVVELMQARRYFIPFQISNMQKIQSRLFQKSQGQTRCAS
jgi:hypothetical protein